MIVAPLSSVLASTIARAENGEGLTTLVVKAAQHKVEYAKLRVDTGRVVWRWPCLGAIERTGAILDILV